MTEDDTGSPHREQQSDSQTTAETDLSPATAFELLAHETRVAVLEALREASGGPLSFGEIRDSVGIEDPGQCHYHVDRLRGQFVEKTDDGYQLSPAGWQLVGAILSGSVTSSLWLLVARCPDNSGADHLDRDARGRNRREGKRVPGEHPHTVVRDSLPPWLVKTRFSKSLSPKYVSRSRK